VGRAARRGLRSTSIERLGRGGGARVRHNGYFRPGDFVAQDPALGQLETPVRVGEAGRVGHATLEININTSNEVV